MTRAMHNTLHKRLLPAATALGLGQGTLPRVHAVTPAFWLGHAACVPPWNVTPSLLRAVPNIDVRGRGGVYSVLRKERVAATTAAQAPHAPEPASASGGQAQPRRKPVKVFPSARCLSWFVGPHGECCDVILGARGQLQVRRGGCVRGWVCRLARWQRSLTSGAGSHTTQGRKGRDVVPRVSKSGLFASFVKAVGAAAPRASHTGPGPDPPSASTGVTGSHGHATPAAPPAPDSAATSTHTGRDCVCLGWSYGRWKAAAERYALKRKELLATDLFARWLVSDNEVDEGVACGVCVA